MPGVRGERAEVEGGLRDVAEQRENFQRLTAGRAAIDPESQAGVAMGVDRVMVQRERSPRARGDGDGRGAGVNGRGVGGIDGSPGPVLPTVEQGVVVHGKICQDLGAFNGEHDVVDVEGGLGDAGALLQPETAS